jgi:hypothetical protein
MKLNPDKLLDKLKGQLQSGSVSGGVNHLPVTATSTPTAIKEGDKGVDDLNLRS